MRTELARDRSGSRIAHSGRRIRTTRRRRGSSDRRRETSPTLRLPSVIAARASGLPPWYACVLYETPRSYECALSRLRQERSGNDPRRQVALRHPRPDRPLTRAGRRPNGEVGDPARHGVSRKQLARAERAARQQVHFARERQVGKECALRTMSSARRSNRLADPAHRLSTGTVLAESFRMLRVRWRSRHAVSVWE